MRSRRQFVNTLPNDHAQVEGCTRALGALSAYHQKCRICDLHIKAAAFQRAGAVQRFCQRCGRAHGLDAFEGTRRSCRAQLAKHNARCARPRTLAPKTQNTMPGALYTAHCPWFRACAL